MPTIETSVTQYKLKAFQSSNDPDFKNALKIYTDSIGNSSQTSTNEIAYCLDNYNAQFLDSKFVVAGFYQNRQLAGYCQFIYMIREKLMIIDYLVIDEKFRGLNTFYSFIEKIKEFVLANDMQVTFLMGEINIQNNSEENMPIKARTLIRLLKANNFGVIESDYYQPMLGAANFESAQRSILMLYPFDQYHSVKKETYLSLVESIYYKHYERWFRLFLTESEMIKYSQHLHELYEKIKKSVKDDLVVNVSGEKDLFGGVDPINTRSKIKTPVIVSVGFIGLLILFTSIGVVAKKYFAIELKDMAYLFGATAIALLIILSFFLDSASKLLSKLLEKAMDKITG